MRNLIDSNSGNDEYYTPMVFVKPILKYIPKSWVIWCPFDTKDSNFVIALKEKGFDIHYSHLIDGKDFFNYQPNYFDCVISNPPFSKKYKVVDRLMLLNKPFMMVMPISILSDKHLYQYLLHNKDFGLIFFDSRISYDGKLPTFSSIYLCYKMGIRLEFLHLSNNNTGKYFVVPSMDQTINYLSVFDFQF